MENQSFLEVIQVFLRLVVHGTTYIDSKKYMLGFEINYKLGFIKQVNKLLRCLLTAMKPETILHYKENS